MTYAAHDFIVSLAKVRGVQCAVEYAEAFEVIRVIFKFREAGRLRTRAARKISLPH